MKRRSFILSTVGILQASTLIGSTARTDVMYFRDDGIVPNSIYPVIRYRSAFNKSKDSGAEWLENTFKQNNWYNSWRNGIFTFQHYHSITHEVLGIYSGEALVLLGGEKGEKIQVKKGDIIVIPAGVGHMNLGDNDLGVVGAYPNGMDVDIMRCKPGERPGVDKNIGSVPFPATDPFLGNNAGIITSWKR
jgi:uncharacterized protein YjlB